MSKKLKASLRKILVGIVMVASIVSLSGVSALVPTAHAATYVTGDLVRNPSAGGMAQYDIYVVKVVGTKMFKRLVLSPAIFNSYGGLFKWSNVKLVSTDVMNQFKTSALVRVETDPKVYALQPTDDTGAKSWLNVSAADFVAAGGDWDSIYVINGIDGAGYTAAADLTTQSQVSTFLTAGTLPGGTPGPAAGTPLSVMLASDTPAGTNVLAGSANNTATKVVFTADSAADTNITSLTIKSYGTALLNNVDIALVKIFDGTVQKGLSQTQVNGISTFTFAPAINIAKGTSKTLSVVVDIAAGGTPSATVKMGIDSATSITGANFTGTFPVVGNSQTIVAGGAIGALTVTAGAPVPVTNTYVGSKDVVFANLIVTSGTNEDVNINQFNVSYGTSAAALITDTDVSNIRVKVDGAVVGSPASFSSRRATIDLTTPIPLTKGNSKTFQVIGDIVSGAARNIELDNAVNSVNGMGVTSKVGVTGGGVAGVTVALGATSRILIGAGVLSVSVSSASPAGSSATVVRSITPQVLGVYDIRAIGEDMLINAVGISLNDAANDFGGAAAVVSNVGLYNEAGALLSNQLNYTAAQMAANTGQRFVLNWTVPANTTAKLYVKGTTNTLTVGANVGPNVIATTLRLVANAALTQSIVATGMSSSGIAGPNNIVSVSVLPLPAMTIRATGTFTGVGDNTTTALNQNVIGPVSQVTIGYLKVTAQNEDQTYRQVLLRPVTTGAATFDLVASGVALFDGTTQVTNFVAPSAAAGGTCINAADIAVGDVCFALTDTLVPTTFTLNTPKSLKIVANLLTPAPEASTMRLTVPAISLTTLGKTSGTVATNAGALNLQTTTNLGAGGQYTTRSNVVEIIKDATSPSGGVRGTAVTHAVWQLTANGTANTLDVSKITFTSRVGLPNVAGNLATIAMFRLYNVSTGQNIATQASVVNNALGTVTFDGIVPGRLQLTRGVAQKIALQVTTTSTAVWPINTQLQWSIATAADVSVGAYGPNGVDATAVLVGAGLAGNTDFGAVIALPTLALGAGATAKTGGAGAAFVLGTDELFLKSDGAITISAGDTLLIPSNADIVAGRYAGRVWIAGDPGIGATGVAVPTLAIGNIGAVGMTGNAAAAGVYGTTGWYIKGNVAPAGTVQANDLRALGGGTVLTGKDYSGAVGYGGTTWSLPADANTVTLP